ncbi:MAG: hypothetical protein FJ272_07000, partial [Planctomycetes bacterium]|nr:hypothetical protein [Planctomycetota bacterium]
MSVRTPTTNHRTPRPFRAVAALLLALAVRAHAGGMPENAVVVVNADSWASARVANEYVRLRQIPPSHVIYLSGLSDFE